MGIPARHGAAARGYRGDGGNGGEKGPRQPQSRDCRTARTRRRGHLQAALHPAVGPQHWPRARQRGVRRMAQRQQDHALRQELRPRARPPYRLRAYRQQQVPAGQPVQHPQPRDQTPRHRAVCQRLPLGGGRNQNTRAAFCFMARCCLRHPRWVRE